MKMRVHRHMLNGRRIGAAHCFINTGATLYVWGYRRAGKVSYFCKVRYPLGFGSTCRIVGARVAGRRLSSVVGS